MIRKMLQWAGIAVKQGSGLDALGSRKSDDDKWPIGNYVGIEAEHYQIDFDKIDDAYIQGAHYTEAEVRGIVGAPSKEEELTCTCGDKVTDCPDAYVHMSKGF